MLLLITGILLLTAVILFISQHKKFKKRSPSSNAFSGSLHISLFQLGSKKHVLDEESLIKSLEARISKDYYNYMADIAVILGADREVAKNELPKYVKFKINVTKVSVPIERHDSKKIFKPAKIIEIRITYSGIPWMEYLLPPEIEATSDELIINLIPSYRKLLENLLVKTSLRVLPNYVKWNNVIISVNYLAEELTKRKLDYETLLSKNFEKENAYIIPTRGGLHSHKKLQKKDSKKKSIHTVQVPKLEYKRNWDKLDWLDGVTKRTAFEKFACMKNHISYPDELYGKGTEHPYIKCLDENRYPESIFHLNNFDNDSLFLRYRQPINKTDWIIYTKPSVMNCVQSLFDNNIQIPASILQGPCLFNTGRRFASVCSADYVLGHDANSVFNYQGNRLDKESVNLWSPAAKNTEYIIQQYGRYQTKEVHMNLNGVSASNDNLAVNARIKQAYMVYKNLLNRNSLEHNVFSVPHTPQQMFWIGAVRTWCSKHQRDFLKTMVVTQTYSPARFRVTGPMNN